MLIQDPTSRRIKLDLPLREGILESFVETRDNLFRSVEAGLSSSSPNLDYRLLYDATGSRIFEEITNLPDYYLTRIEALLLMQNAAEIAALAGPVPLVELGAGSGRKTRYLIDAFEASYGSARYIPVDVSETALKMASTTLSMRHPRTQILPMHAQHQMALSLLESIGPALVIFLGSSIGNFSEDEEDFFYAQLNRRMPFGGFFLLGVDLIKAPGIIESAYNDSAGVTASFIANLFRRLQRELGLELDMNGFEFKTRYDKRHERMELYARFDKAIRLSSDVSNRSVEVVPGEPILVEICRKYCLCSLDKHLQKHGLRVLRVFMDQNEWFADLLITHRDNRDF